MSLSFAVPKGPNAPVRHCHSNMPLYETEMRKQPQACLLLTQKSQHPIMRYSKSTPQLPYCRGQFKMLTVTSDRVADHASAALQVGSVAAAMLGFSGTSPKSKPGRGVRASRTFAAMIHLFVASLFAVLVALFLDNKGIKSLSFAFQ